MHHTSSGTRGSHPPAAACIGGVATLGFRKLVIVRLQEPGVVIYQQLPAYRVEEIVRDVREPVIRSNRSCTRISVEAIGLKRLVIYKQLPANRVEDVRDVREPDIRSTRSCTRIGVEAIGLKRFVIRQQSPARRVHDLGLLLQKKVFPSPKNVSSRDSVSKVHKRSVPISL